MRRKWTKERPEVDTTFELLFKNNPLPLWVYDLETLRFLDINEVAAISMVIRAKSSSR